VAHEVLTKPDVDVPPEPLPRRAGPLAVARFWVRHRMVTPKYALLVARHVLIDRVRARRGAWGVGIWEQSDQACRIGIARQNCSVVKSLDSTASAPAAGRDAMA
jgi:hypothetical protein